MQKNIRSYVIGGGVSGLIWSFYNPEFKIISPNLGGMYARTHLVWLHDTEYTRKLLKDLDLPIKYKKSYIGYCDTWISDTQNNELNEEIIKRKMTPWNEKINDKFIPKTRDLSLNKPGENNFMNTLDVDLEEVITRLSLNANIENGFVFQITPTHILAKLNESDESTAEIAYDNLVTTIPAPLFWKAYDETYNIDLKSIPITSVIVDKMPPMYDNTYEMIYYTRKFPFSRISHLGGKYAFEFTGIITKEEFQKLYPDLPVVEYFIVKNGRIWENELHTSPQENIIFSGRFSEWKYKVVTETVLAQAITYSLNK